MQLSKTPQITFGIKHSPLLGQLKPIEPFRSTHNEREVTQKIGSQHFADTKHLELKDVQDNNQIRESITHFDDSAKISEHSIHNERYNQQRFANETIDSSNVNNVHNSSRITQIRTENDLRSATGTPEPVQETLTQEIVWIPEQPIARRGSYTIENDGNSYLERFQDGSVVPVENGIIRTAVQGERGGAVKQDSNSELIRREGFEQSIQTDVKSARAHEKSQAATEEVRTGTEVQKLANGGIAKTTTTTTVKKIGTVAKTANATTTVSRTATAVTSRDVGAK